MLSNLTLEVKNVTLLLTTNGDELTIVTCLPDTKWPYKNDLKMKVELAKGRGVEYCKEHFPHLDVKVIDITPIKPYSRKDTAPSTI